MKLIAYSLGGQKLAIRPAPSSRAWLDKLPDAYGYRCLPLNLGSAHGWEILCPVGCVVMWNGQEGLDAIVVRPDKEVGWVPASHFGSGILTFHTRYLFRTEPGYNLYVTGPTNNRKHGIVPLAAIVETDWSPYTFTMNWAFTQAGGMRFEEGEPFCMIFPVQRGLIDSIEPEIRDIADDPETKKRSSRSSCSTARRSPSRTWRCSCSAACSTMCWPARRARDHRRRHLRRHRLGRHRGLPRPRGGRHRHPPPRRPHQRGAAPADDHGAGAQRPNIAVEGTSTTARTW
jgi:hypothetical protein